MKIIEINQKRILQINAQEIRQEIRQQANWGDRFDAAKESAKRYWQGLQQIREIQKNPFQTKRDDLYQSFESVPQIGKGLSQYRVDLDHSTKIFQDLMTEIQLSNLSNPEETQHIAEKANKLIANLRPIGIQLLTKAIHSVPNADLQNNTLGIQSLGPVVQIATNLGNQMLSQLKTETIDYHQPELAPTYQQVVDSVLGLPEPIKIEVVREIIENLSPQEKGQTLSPIRPQTVPTSTKSTQPENWDMSAIASIPLRAQRHS